MLETAMPSKIRIRYFFYTFKILAVLHKQAELVAVLGWTFLLQYGEIPLIHCQYEMKNLDILFVYASGTQPIFFISSLGCRFLGPVVWGLANVIVVCTRRIDINLVFKTSSFDLMPEYGFRRG